MLESTKLRLKAAACSALGSIAPDVLILYSKRWAAEPMVFPHWQYFVASLMYLAVAGLIGAIFPYSPRPTPWKGFGVGVGTPVILSALASAAKPISLAPRGMELPPSFWDLISLW